MALTDRIPDEKLVEAAKSGKLSTKEDYKREVLRILADQSIDKPRLLRFFQDYFGYYNMFNISAQTSEPSYDEASNKMTWTNKNGHK